MPPSRSHLILPFRHRSPRFRALWHARHHNMGQLPPDGTLRFSARRTVVDGESAHTAVTSRVHNLSLARQSTVTVDTRIHTLSLNLAIPEYSSGLIPNSDICQRAARETSLVELRLHACRASFESVDFRPANVEAVA